MLSSPDRLPQYHLPVRLMVKVIASLISGQTRSFKKDAEEALSGISGLRIIGEPANLELFEHGCLLTVNHYSRAGFSTWWMALAITAVFPSELHWGMTSAFTYPDRFRSHLFTPITSLVLKRLAKIYHFTSMPPMPPRPAEQTERAIAVRSLVRQAHAVQRPVIGFAPEGMDHSDGQLADPPAGVGRLIAYLSGLGMGIQPVGVYEEDGCLFLHFGIPYFISKTEVRSSRSLDTEIAHKVTAEIAKCLPDRYYLQDFTPLESRG